MGDIRILVEVDAKKGTAAIKDLDDNVDSLGRRSNKSIGGIKNLWKSVAAGMVVVAGVSKAMSGFINFMKAAVTAAGEQEDAENSLRAALESTGREVLDNSDHYRKFASEVQNATRYGDEQVMSVQTLLIQLTKLSRDGIDRATKAAVGLATVYKTDLNSAAALVGKALAGNYSALSRYGIAVEKTMTDEEKRNSILDQLGVMYQRAEADTETFTGTLTQLKNVYGDITEEIGKVVTENEDLKKGIKDLTTLLSNMIELGVFEDMGKQIGSVVKWIPQINALKAAFQIYYDLSEERVAVLRQQTKSEEAARGILKGLVLVHTEHGLELKMTTPIVKENEEAQKNLAVAYELGATAISNAAGEGKRFIKEQGKIRAVTVDLVDLWQSIPGTMEESIPYYNGVTLAARDMSQVHLSVLGEINNTTEATYKSLGERAMEWALKHEEAVYHVANITFDLLGQIDAISYQLAENEMIRIDNQYEKKKKSIEDSTLLEGEKARLLENLEAATEAKRRTIIRRAAKVEKAVSLMAAIVNTAAAVTKALSAAPPPFNLALAAISGAIGAVQIAAIASQPIPLAKGGIFPGPTFLVGESGPEVIMPLERIPEVVREIQGVGSRDGGGTLIIYQTIKIGDKEYSVTTRKSLPRDAAVGKIHLPVKAIV